MTPRSFSESEWGVLLRNIRAGRCVPVLGAGAAASTLPMASQITKEWVRDYGYPLSGEPDLMTMGQYLATTNDPLYPKQILVERYGRVEASSDAEPYATLSTLPLPVYITTNYDSFMEQALRTRYKETRWEVCRWNAYVEDFVEAPDDAYEPNVANPLVFHLHGAFQSAASMVLTEDDYLALLVRMAEDPDLIPRRIRRAMQGSSLLFVGYRLADSTYRVLHQRLVMGLPSAIAPKSFTVLRLPVPDDAPEGARQEAIEYMDAYFRSLRIAAYYGDAADFAAELRRRLEAVS